MSRTCWSTKTPLLASTVANGPMPEWMLMNRLLRSFILTFYTLLCKISFEPINQKSVDIYHQNLIPKILSLCLILATKANYYL